LHDDALLTAAARAMRPIIENMSERGDAPKV
jgi:hypothetical protein